MSVEKLFGEFYREEPKNAVVEPLRKNPRVIPFASLLQKHAPLVLQVLRRIRVSRRIFIFVILVAVSVYAFGYLKEQYTRFQNDIPSLSIQQTTTASLTSLPLTSSVKPMQFVVKLPSRRLFGVTVGNNDPYDKKRDVLTAKLISPQGGEYTLRTRVVAAKLSAQNKKYLEVVKKAQAAVDTQENDSDLEAFLAEDPSAVVITPAGDGEVTVTVPSLTDLSQTIPGNYRLVVEWTRDGVTYTAYQEFTWGVLVMNAAKDIYEKGEIAQIAIGLVDSKGNTVCDGALSAVITSPSGKKKTISTHRNSQDVIGNLSVSQAAQVEKMTGKPADMIYFGEECGPQTVTEIPDYYFSFQAEEVGNYAIHVVAQTNQGEKFIDQQLKVVESNELIIKRSAASRIYPLSPYTMSLTLVSKKAYRGEVIETVPLGFTIRCETCTLRHEAERIRIVWDVVFQPGQSKTLSYTYTAPPVSPALYMLGPLETSVRVEDRAFAIAADAVNTLLVGPRSAISSGDCVDDSNIGSAAWTNPGNAAKADGTLATVSLSGATSHYIKCTNFGFNTSQIPTGASISGVMVTVSRKTSTAGDGTDAAVRLVVGGTIGTTDKSTATPYTAELVPEDHGGLGELWGNSLSTSDVTSSNFGAAYAAVKSGAPARTISVDVIYVTVFYVPPQVTLNQRNYIFEDDDGSTVNGNTDIAAANTAITDVKKGERINARFQIDNTSAYAYTPEQYELFYDRSDNIWTRVEASGSAAVVPGTGNCTDTNWDCITVDSSSSVLANSDITISPAGQPWISNTDGTYLRVANYVGSGGNCPSSTAWNCQQVDVGDDSSIGFNASGSAMISYRSLGKLKVATYVGGSGGNCSTATDWVCTTVDSSGGVLSGYESSIGFSASGSAWVSYSDAGNSLVRVANYVGSGGNCTSTAWNCTTVTSASNAYFTDMAFDQLGNPWIASGLQTLGDFVVAKYVGSGGNCTSTAWKCMTVDNNVGIGRMGGIAFDPSGTAWATYMDSTGYLILATYVGSGGNCTSGEWNCTTIDSTVSAAYSDIAFDASGVAWISYFDDTNDKPKVANYVGSGGNCTSTAWNCATLDSNVTAGGEYAQIAFSPSGNAWLSYFDNTNNTIKAANMKRGGEIIPAYGLSGAPGAILTANAAGSCTGGTSFSNCSWWQGVNLSASSSAFFSLGSNNCTEISYMIDTSRAIVGTTYRLRLRNTSQGAGLGTYTQSPTFTIVSSGNDTMRVSKDSQYALSNCTDTNWGCGTINSNAQLTIREHSMAFDASGSAWISSYDNWNSHLWVSRYVGTNGGGCGGSITDWKCTKLDDKATTGEYNFIAFDPKGTALISYYDRTNGNLNLATYVGTGGTGCTAGVTDWTCEAIDGKDIDTGGQTSIDFDSGGNPWISEFEGTQTLRVARYVGSGGTGCISTKWTCTYVDKGASMGRYSHIKFNNQGKPVMTYTDQSNNAIRFAEYVGSGGGTGCGTGASTEWICTTVDDQTNTLGQNYMGLGIDSYDKPWIAYIDATASDLWIARYVGTGGSGCTGSTVTGAWSCSVIDSSSAYGSYISLAMGPDNVPWISYHDATATSLRVARYVGSSGTGCASTAWTCTTVDNQSTSTGGYTAIAFDPSGVPWVAESDMSAVAWNLKIAKLHYPPYDNQNRYSLDNLGYTAVTTDDQTFDSMAATTNVPIYRMSTRYGSATTTPTVTWKGKSSVAASTDNILLQAYRFGSTNAWETLTTNSSCGANLGCTVIGTPAGTLSEYFEADGSNYWVHYRTYQVAGTSKTLQTGYFNASYAPASLKFATSVNNVDSGVCSGASVPFTISILDANGNSTTPTGTTVVQITSDSSSYAIYSDSSCSTLYASGNITFTPANPSKTFYLIDSVRGTHVLTATKTSGPDTMTTTTQFQVTNTAGGDIDSTTIRGGVDFRGGSTIR